MSRHTKAAAARAEHAEKIADEWFGKVREGDAFPTDADGTPIPVDPGDTAPIPTQPAAPSADLVPVASNGHRGQKYADLTSIVHTAETLRFDAHTTVGLETEHDAVADLLALARAQEANREVVDPATLRQLKDHAARFTSQLESWLLQRGIKDNGGGS